MSIKLSATDIDYILKEINLTDRVDPFGELAYLLEYVDARVLDALPRRITPTAEELRETSEKLLRLLALSSVYQSYVIETYTALNRYSEEVIQQIIRDMKAELST